MPPRGRLGQLDRQFRELQSLARMKLKQKEQHHEHISFKEFCVQKIAPLIGKPLDYPHLQVYYDTLPTVKRHLYLDHRGSLKSTVVAQAYPTWRFWENPEDTGTIAAASQSLARKNLYAIAQFALRLGMKPSAPDKWTQNEIMFERNYVSKDPSLVAVGVDTNSVGTHSNFIIYDDIVNDENISEAGRKRVKRFVYEVMKPVLNPQGQEIFIGTHWHFDDVYRHFEQSWPKEDVTVNGVWADAERRIPRFPAVFTPEHIDSLKAEMPTDAFARQYLNSILQAENRPFKLEYLVHYNMETMKWHNIDEAWQTVQAVDFISSEKERRDWFVTLILSRNNEGKFYIRELVREQTSVQKEVDIVERLFKAYSPFKVAIGAGGSQMLISLLKGATNWPILPIPERTHKAERINALSGFFEQRRIHLPMNASWYKNFELEYLEWPDSKHDDQLDALAMAFQAFGKQSAGWVIMNPEAIELRPGHMRDFEGRGFTSS